jgi:hypothetical protein
MRVIIKNEGTWRCPRWGYPEKDVKFNGFDENMGFSFVTAHRLRFFNGEDAITSPYILVYEDEYAGSFHRGYYTLLDDHDNKPYLYAGESVELLLTFEYDIIHKPIQWPPPVEPRSGIWLDPRVKYFGALVPGWVVQRSAEDPNPQSPYPHPPGEGSKIYSCQRGYYFNSGGYLRNNDNSPNIASIGTKDFTLTFFVAPTGPNASLKQTILATQEIGTYAYPGYTNVGFSVYLTYNTEDPDNAILGFKIGDFDIPNACTIKKSKANNASEIWGRTPLEIFGDYTHITITRINNSYYVFKNFERAFEVGGFEGDPQYDIRAPRITIGGQWINSDAGGIANLFKGAIDEVAIWDRPMSFSWVENVSQDYGAPVKFELDIFGGSLKQYYKWAGEFHAGADDYSRQFTYPFGFYVHFDDFNRDVYPGVTVDIPVSAVNGYCIARAQLLDTYASLGQEAMVQGHPVGVVQTHRPIKGYYDDALPIPNQFAPFNYVSTSSGNTTGKLTGVYHEDLLLDEINWTEYTEEHINPVTGDTFVRAWYGEKWNMDNPTPVSAIVSINDDESINYRGSGWFFTDELGKIPPDFFSRPYYTNECFLNIFDKLYRPATPPYAGIDIGYRFFITRLGYPGGYTRTQLCDLAEGIEKDNQIHFYTGYSDNLATHTNNYWGVSTDPIIFTLNRPGGNPISAHIKMFDNSQTNRLRAEFTPTASTPSTSKGLTATIIGNTVTITGTPAFSLAGLSQIKIEINGPSYKNIHVVNVNFLSPFLGCYFNFNSLDINKPVENGLLYMTFPSNIGLSDLNKLLKLVSFNSISRYGYPLYIPYTLPDFNDENGDTISGAVGNSGPPGTDLVFYPMGYGFENTYGTGERKLSGWPTGVVISKIPNYQVTSIDNSFGVTKVAPFTVTGTPQVSIMHFNSDTYNVTLEPYNGEVDQLLNTLVENNSTCFRAKNYTEFVLGIWGYANFEGNNGNAVWHDYPKNTSSAYYDYTPGYILEKSTTDEKYEFIAGAFTWDQAIADASSRGGSLAVFHDEDSWIDFLIFYGNKFGRVSARIGCEAVESSTTEWRWVDGQTATFFNWASGQPNRGGTYQLAAGENSVIILMSGGLYPELLTGFTTTTMMINPDISISPISKKNIVLAPGQSYIDAINIPINVTGPLITNGLVAPDSNHPADYDYGLLYGMYIKQTPPYAILGSVQSSLGTTVRIVAKSLHSNYAVDFDLFVDTFGFIPDQEFRNFHGRYLPPFVPATNYPEWVESWATPIGLPPGISQDPVSGLVSGGISTQGSGTTTFKAVHGAYTVDSYGFPWDMIYTPPQALYMVLKIPLFEYFRMQLQISDDQWPVDSLSLEIVSGSLPTDVTLDGNTGILSGYCRDVNYSPQILVIRFSDQYGILYTHSYPIFTSVNSLLITPFFEFNYTLGDSAYNQIYYTDIPINRWVYDKQEYAWGDWTNNLLPFEITKEGYLKYTHWTRGDYYNTREFNLFPIGDSNTLFYGTSNDPYFYLSAGEYIQGGGILPGTQVVAIDYGSTPYHYTLNLPAYPSGIINTVQAGLGLKVYNGHNIYEVTAEGNFGSAPPEFTSGSAQNGTASLRYISGFSNEYTAQFKTKYKAIYDTVSPPQFKVQQSFSTGGVEITGISHLITYGEKAQLLGALWIVSGGDTLHRLELITPGDSFQERHPENNPDSPVPNTYSIQDIKDKHDIWDSYDIIYRPTVYSLRDLHSIIQGPGAYSTDIFISANGQIIKGSLAYNDPKSMNFNVYFTGGALSNHTLKGLAFDKDDILYVVDSTMNNISKIVSHTGINGYITRTAVVYATGSPQFPLSDPSAIAFDLESNLYVTNLGHNNILKFPKGGGAAPELFASDISSTAIACSNGNNTLFVVDKINSKIIEFSTNGEIIKTIYSKTIDAENSLNNPSAITFPRGGLDFIVANSVATPQIIHVFNNTIYSNTAFITINLDRGLPAITPNQTFSGTINVFLEFIILRDNNNQINSWRLIDKDNVNLEISIDPYSGVVYGVPGIAGLFTYLVKATNDQGEDTKEITIDIAGIVPTILPGQSFSLYIGDPNNASDPIQYSGTTADSWQIVSITGGTPDVTINFLGQFVGVTPRSVGTYIVNITATNRAGTSAVTSVTLNILLPYPVITSGQYVYTATNTNINYDVAYIGSAPNHWELEIPQGTTLAISNSGKITGKIPYEAQLSLVIAASNDSGISEDRINIVAADSPPIITPNQVFSDQINTYFNSAILYSGTADTWSLTTGNVLPEGLTLTPRTGVITGIPTMAGIYTNISITARSDKGGIDVRTINIVISNVGSLIQIAEGQVINATGVSTFTFTPTYTGEPNRWDAANLPAWLTINHTTGTLTGTTTGIAHGSYSYCVYAKDDLGNSSAAFIKIQI